jgi:F0F1-type ATP synthase membrane subunit b/b'
MMVVKDFKKGINNSLKKIQKNTAKQVEALIYEAQKSLKELQKNTANQVEALKELQANTAKLVEETQKSLKELQEITTKQGMELNKASKI